MKKQNLNSEYSHIEHVLENLEDKVNSIQNELAILKKDFSKINDISNCFSTEIGNFERLANKCNLTCAELEGYFAYLQEDYFPGFEFRLENKIELSSDDIITTLTSDLSEDYKDIKTILLDSFSNINIKLDKILKILIKVKPNND